MCFLKVWHPTQYTYFHCFIFQVLSHGADCSTKNLVGGVIVSVLVSSAVDCGFELRSDQTKVYKTGICCFSAKHRAIRARAKTCLLGIIKICPSGATCLSVDCWFS